MFKKNCIVFFFLFPIYFQVLAFTISGKVISSKDNTPIEFANIFIANTTFGVVSDVNGNFILNIRLDGNLEFVVTHISYDTYSRVLQVNSDISNLIISLNEKIYSLKDVDISGQNLREKNLLAFKNLLLGETPYSEQCTIINPNAIRFRSDKNNGSLRANTDTFLIIRNDALGYIVKYKIENLFISYPESFYYGFVSFEDKIDSLKRKKKRTIKNRIEAYKGSSQHFLKNVYYNLTGTDGFKVCQAIESPRDTLVNLKNPLSGVDFYHPAFLKNSKNKLLLTFNEFPINSFLRDTINGWKILDYPHPFVIYYNKGKGSASLRTIAMLRHGRIFVDKYGLPDFPVDFMMFGSMSNKRVGEMLPLNFDLQMAELELSSL